MEKKNKVYYKGPEQQQEKSTHGAQTLVVADETLKTGRCKNWAVVDLRRLGVVGTMEGGAQNSSMNELNKE